MEVLILVLVEDGLGVEKATVVDSQYGRLNPCFSGGWSRSTMGLTLNNYTKECLNPCFSGGWSRRKGG